MLSRYGLHSVRPLAVRPVLPSKRTAPQVPKPARPPYVCATSTPGLDTIVHGLVAVKQKGKQDSQTALKFLVDTGATESCISERLASSIGAPIRSCIEELRMANGSTAVSKGTTVSPICIQGYWDEIVLKVFPMNDNFDIILGSDWCRTCTSQNCNIMFSTNSVNIESPCTRHYHELATQLITHGMLCPVISAIGLDKHISGEDETFVCHVRAQEPDSN